MKKLIKCALLAAMTAGVSMGGDISYDSGPAGGGAWETDENWGGGAGITSADVARPAWGTTADSHTVTLNSPVSVLGTQNGVNRQGTLIIGAGGILTCTDNTKYNSVGWNDNDASFVVLTNGGAWNITSTARLAIGRQDNAQGSALDIYSGSSLSLLNDLEFNDGAVSFLGLTSYTATIHDGGSATVNRLQFQLGNGQLDIKDGGSITITSDQAGYVASAITAGNIISSDGTLSVGAWDGSSMTITAIPEPATLGLLALFGGGMLVIRRRFKI